MDTEIINSNQVEENLTSTPMDNDADIDNVTFEDLGLDEYTLAAVARKGFVTPSPIQVLAIPRLLNGDTNLIARARTGTGKTAAFGLPIIQTIKEKSDSVQALILEPTRELAMQTNTEMQSFATDGIPRTTVLYGGASYSTQIKDLKRGCEIVVGTPGRIKDHIEKKTLDLSKIKYFILDEGDEMLDMGFIDDIRDIFQYANPDCRILLFSATMPAPILKIAADFMGDYEIIEEEKVIDEALAIDQQYWVVRESDKIEALVRLIDMSPDFYGLVFTQTKMDADNVTRQLDLRGYESAALHGDIMQNQREKVLERFRMKKTRILVATDVAARGIDITGLSHVVNYSLPFDAATYVHRIGRTGRAGAEGTAITFVRPEERRKLGFMQRAVQKASKGEMKQGEIPTINEVLTIKENRLFDELRTKLFVQNEKSEDETAEITESDDLKKSKESEETVSQTESAQQASVTEGSEKSAETVENTAVTEATDEVKAENTETEQKITDSEEETVSNGPVLVEAPKKYHDLAHSLCENQDPEEVLATVLSVMYGDKLSPRSYGKINVPKDYAPNGNQLRVFISLGKKDGYHAREIADYFSDLLHIPGRMVDQIDVAQQFSLVNLPIASARKAIEMSKSNRSLPHMHLDVKEEGHGSRKGGRDRNFGGRDGDFKERTRAPRRDNESEENSFERPKGEHFGKKNHEDDMNFHKGNEPRDFGGRSGGKRSRSSEGRRENGREGRSKGSRPNVHTQSERSSSRKSSSASSFIKKSGKAERF